MENVIQVENLCKTFKVSKKENSFIKYLFNRKYQTIDAVKNVSFSIKEGELVGFIGPNGAGKSTTIKMLTGILMPSSGKIQVLGKDPNKYRKLNAKSIGVLFGQRSQLWWDLPVFDTYLLLKKIYKIPQNIFQKNLSKYSDILKLDKFIYQPVRQLSLGQRMRADLCAALLHNPQVLFLDEPTIGLDVVVKQQIREMIKQINEENMTTVILTTHDMKDVEEICNRLIVINDGKVVIDGPIEQVKADFAVIESVEIFFNKMPDVLSICLNGITNVKYNEQSVSVYYDPRAINAAQIITTVLNQHNHVIDISLNKADIDDVIREMYLKHY